MRYRIKFRIHIKKFQKLCKRPKDKRFFKITSFQKLNKKITKSNEANIMIEKVISQSNFTLLHF